MKLGRVVGKVWATIKDPKLAGIKLCLLQPVDEFDQPIGKPVVAVDSINSREGDLVFWVSSGEATLVYEHIQLPTDISITGLVDRLNID